MNNELYHYGVKGMKWGVRRYAAKAAISAVPKLTGKAAKRTAKNTAIGVVKKAASPKRYSQRTIDRYDKKIAKKIGDLNPNYHKIDAINDYRNLGKKSVKRINRRMNDGSDYKKAYAVEVGRKATIDIVSEVGAKAVTTFAGAAIVKLGSDFARYYVNTKMGVKRLGTSSVITLTPDQYKVL